MASFGVILGAIRGVILWQEKTISLGGNAIYCRMLLR
jgi:hypothetical protein